MTCCDLSEEVTECVQNEIEGKPLDLCEGCPLAEPLSDGGRVKASLKVLEAVEIEEYEETLI